jgi:hypothetical protein
MRERNSVPQQAVEESLAFGERKPGVALPVAY